MTPAKTQAKPAITDQVLQAFDNLNGPHPGFRPGHAKGILIAGRFTPASDAASLTRAPHIKRSSTPVTIRFSNATGIPSIPDGDPNASPRGLAVRFHLEPHVHTDIIAHSVNGFPASTAEEFVDFLRAIHASGPGVPGPMPIERFLAAHPAALAFVQAPKPIPASFLTESFYSVSAHRFVNAEGESVYGRYRIRPDGDNRYLDAATVAGKSPNFLFDELKEQLTESTARMRVTVQIAAQDDVVNDATVQWPEDRREVEFGSIEVMSVLSDNDAAQQHIIFDPIPRVDGIEASDDPLLEVRASVYLASGRRRRQA